MWNKTRTLTLAVLAVSAAAVVSAPANADHRGHGKSYRTTVHVKKTIVHERHGRNWRKHRHHVRDRHRGHRHYWRRPHYRKKVVHKHYYHEPRPHYRKKVVHHHYRHSSSGGAYPYGNRTVAGGLIGAAIGALAGNQIGRGGGRVVATVTGGVIGAVVGGSIGDAMDRNDRTHASQVLDTAKTGEVIAWRNPRSGAEYSVKPTAEYRTKSGEYCREFSTWGWIGGYEEKLHGTACRMPDGSWRRVR